MNILVSPLAGGTFSFRSDSTLIRAMTDFYIPDYVESISAVPAMFFRSERSRESSQGGVRSPLSGTVFMRHTAKGFHLFRYGCRSRPHIRRKCTGLLHCYSIRPEPHRKSPWRHFGIKAIYFENKRNRKVKSGKLSGNARTMHALCRHKPLLFRQNRGHDGL